MTSSADKKIIRSLSSGRSVKTWESGNSLAPLINDGDCVRISPVRDHRALAVDQVVFVMIRPGVFVNHLILKVDETREKPFLIGNHMVARMAGSLPQSSMGKPRAGRTARTTAG